MLGLKHCFPVPVPVSSISTLPVPDLILLALTDDNAKNEIVSFVNPDDIILATALIVVGCRIRHQSVEVSKHHGSKYTCFLLTFILTFLWNITKLQLDTLKVSVSFAITILLLFLVVPMVKIGQLRMALILKMGFLLFIYFT